MLLRWGYIGDIGPKATSLHQKEIAASLASFSIMVTHHYLVA